MLSMTYRKIRKRKFLRSSLFILFFGIAFICGVSFALIYLLDTHDISQTYITGVISGFIFLLPVNVYFIIKFLKNQQSEKIIAAIEAQHDRTLASNPDGVFEWDIKNNTKYWSPRLKEMIGFREDEIDADQNVEDRIHPEDVELRRKSIEAHLNGVTPELSLVFRWLHKDGHWVWMKARGRAVFDENNKPIYLTGTCMDITEIKEYEALLEQARKKAEDESLAKSEFLAHMSHEIRTPLTAISGAAEILTLRKAEMDPKLGKIVGALDTSAQALRELLGGILDFSKIESGLLKLERRPFQISEVFDDIREIMTPRASDKEVGLVVDYTQMPGYTMHGDRLRFKQIIMNLVGNAVKFTEKGNVTVTARRTEHEGKEYFQVTVSDTGIGIRAENIDTIFDRFVQADSSVSRKYGGTGLGLPIARKLAVLMGGDISVTSNFGVGSAFTLCLPAEASQIAGGAALKAIASAGMPAPKSWTGNISKLPENKKILIVEDYEGTVTILSEMIASMGLDFDIAQTGLEALNKWNSNSYGLVLMDIQMPEMDGITALTQIRNIEQERGLLRTPVIAMTAHAFLEDQSKCLEAGFDGYLAKPVSSDELINKINLALHNVAEKEQAI